MRTYAEAYIEKGVQLGRKQGLKQGLEQGLEQGIAQERQRLLRMLSQQSNTATGLTPQQLHKICEALEADDA